VAIGAERHRPAEEEALTSGGAHALPWTTAAARCGRATHSDQLIDKVLAQEQDLFIIAPSVEKLPCRPQGSGQPT
jgi:hypothetical protein